MELCSKHVVCIVEQACCRHLTVNHMFDLNAGGAHFEVRINAQCLCNTLCKLSSSGVNLKYNCTLLTFMQYIYLDTSMYSEARTCTETVHGLYTLRHTAPRCNLFFFFQNMDHRTCSSPQNMLPCD